MELNEYQSKAMTTCLPTSDNFSYMMLNLVGEVGEFASKVGKHIRKGEAEIINNHLFWNSDVLPEEKALEYESLLKSELGDCAWELVGLCKVMGWTFEEVCQENLDKLASRKNRGLIDGNGDTR